MLQKFLHFGHDLLFRFPRAGKQEQICVRTVKPAERIIEYHRYIAVFMFVRLVYDEYGREQEFEFVYFLRWRLFIYQIIYILKKIKFLYNAGMVRL